MKKTILAVATAGALGAALHGYAADAPMPGGAVPKTFEILDVALAALKEQQLQPAYQADFFKRYEAAARFEYSPELRPRLLAVFGSEAPLRPKRVGEAKGRINYVATLMPHTFHDINGRDYRWEQLSVNTAVDRAGNRLDMQASLPLLAIVNKDDKLTLRDLRMDSTQTRSADGVMVGTVRFSMGSLVFDGAQAATGQGAIGNMRIDDFVVASAVARRGKQVEMSSGVSIKALTAGGERIDRINFATRLQGIDAATLGAFNDMMQSPSLAALDQVSRNAIVLRRLTAFGKTIVKQGVSLLFDDVSAAYHGNTASLKGRVGFENVVDADLDTMPALMKKLVARFNVRVPVAMVQDISLTIAGKQGAGKPAETIASEGKNLAALAIGRLVGDGYAVIENGELRSAIEYKNNALTFNGKTVHLGPSIPVRNPPVLPVAPVRKE